MSQFSHKEPCPKCGSKDNLARYTDGHAHCFGMGCDYYEPPTDSIPKQQPERKRMAKPLIPVGEAQRLSARKLKVETCEKFRYTVSDYNGKPVQVANFFVDGELVAQKLRFKDKSFRWRGDPHRAPLYGQWLWAAGGRRLVITEGEIDALTVSQLQDNRWPVVSIKNGAQGAVDEIKEHLEWVESFDEVILAFDMDKPGREAAKAVAEVLSPGKAKIAHLPEKDANACLLEGKGKQLMSALWEAKPHEISGIVGISDLIEEALKPVEWGLPWPWEPLTQMTYGRRRKEAYVFGSGTGIGKTDTMLEIAEFNYRVCGLPTGLILLETPPAETLKRLAGKFAGIPFHLPDAEYNPQVLEDTLRDMEKKNAAYFYNHGGAVATDWDSVKARIRYLAVALGVKDIILDHLTALAAMAEDEKKCLERLCADIGSMVHELDITLYVVSHLTTPDGTPHEEGGRVLLKQFKGSRAIGYWFHFAFGIERDTQHPDPEVRAIATFRCLKDRYTGRANGQVFYYRQNPDTYKNEVCDPPKSDDDAESYGFKDESKSKENSDEPSDF